MDGDFSVRVFHHQCWLLKYFSKACHFNLTYLSELIGFGQVYGHWSVWFERPRGATPRDRLGITLLTAMAPTVLTSSLQTFKCSFLRKCPMT